MKKYIAISLLLIITIAFACSKDQTSHFTPFITPSYFPATSYHFETNQITEGGFYLGKKLFYDSLLSIDNSTSCGTCHIPTSAFTHHGHDLSHGLNGTLTKRNSPAIMNLAWSNSFMWDGGIHDLDLQPISPITNPIEMGETMDHVVAKLKQQPAYKNLFLKAFGTEEITGEKLLKALSQFMLMCVSNNAKYDSVKRGETHFTQTEQSGYDIFLQKCNACHNEPLFTDYSFRNTGLKPSILNDSGRYKITLNDRDLFTFKVPSLRNITYTAPYMHDGRFYSLDAALEHYNSQVMNMPNIDPIFRKESMPGIRLSTDEKNKLIAFLKTLDDHSFVTNPMLGENYSPR
jgi:cytochrome c peroxidase